MKDHVRATYATHQRSRRSIRLKGYDYSQAGAYFFTICTQDRACLFGHVTDGEMRLNDAGQMIEKWWAELNRKFPTIQTDEYVIMPNHFHGIIVINVEPVGADLRVCPNDCPDVCPNDCPDVCPNDCPDVCPNDCPDVCPNDCPDVCPNDCPDVCPNDCPDACPNDGVSHNGESPGAQASGANTSSDAHTISDAHIARGAHIGAPLPEIIQWFKTMTTNEYIRRVKTSGWPSFRGRLWQRNYYEHIIRNDKSLNRIREYIIHNPSQWPLDQDYPDTTETGLKPSLTEDEPCPL